MFWLHTQHELGAALMRTPKKKNRNVTPATQKKVMDAVNEELRAIGLGTFDDVERMTKEMNPKNTIRLVILSAIQRQLNNMPEPAPEELQGVLAAINGKLRYEIRARLSTATQEIKKQLPRRPGGGRGKALTAQQENQARDKVASFIRRKVPYKIALTRVGQQFGVSARTIQRAWQKREEDILEVGHSGDIA